MDNCFEIARVQGYTIIKCYQCFGVDISITGVQTIPSLLRCIFNIKLLPSTRVDSIFTRAKDVQAALNFHLFYPFWEGIAIRIAVSEFDIKENSLL